MFEDHILAVERVFVFSKTIQNSSGVQPSLLFSRHDMMYDMIFINYIWVLNPVAVVRTLCTNRKENNSIHKEKPYTKQYEKTEHTK
jgi:hypothetical protein